MIWWCVDHQERVDKGHLQLEFEVPRGVSPWVSTSAILESVCQYLPSLSIFGSGIWPFAGPLYEIHKRLPGIGL